MQSDQLRCPTCGFNVPPTGTSSGYSVGPEAMAPYQQRGKCPNCHRLLERNLDPPMDQWRLPPEIMSIGGTITLRATPELSAAGGIVHESAASLNASGTIVAGDAHQILPAVETNAVGTVTGARTTVAGTASPRVHAEAGLRRADWEMTCAGFGALVGSPFGKGAMVIGGFVGYFWGRRQWPDSD